MKSVVMRNGRVVLAIARADFLERVREYGFYVTLVLASFLGYATAAGKIILQVGNYRGLYTSGWIGAMVAMVTTIATSLVGFYIVKNAVERDRRTKVGKILASTPLTKWTYTVGKVLSNFAILATIVLVLAFIAVLMVSFVREDPHVDLWGLLSPFLLIALPAMAITAAMAVFFESLPLLRGGLGNVVWFFVWSVGISLPPLARVRWLDPAGLWFTADSMLAAVRKAVPGSDDSFLLTVGGPNTEVVRSVRWSGLQWTPDQVLLRIGWFGLALMVALAAAAFFDRFDSSYSKWAPEPTDSKAHLPPDSITEREDIVDRGAPRRVTTRHLAPLALGGRSFGFFRLFKPELLLALKGRAWWWYLIAVGLALAQFAVPLAIARGPLLGTAWMWLLFVWSKMGTRESRYGTAPILFSSQKILLRQLPACFLVGVTLAATMGAPVGLRLLIARDLAGLLAWAAGVLFLPSLALALGVWTESRKVFEGIVTVLWYLGPINRTAGLDYTGAANGAHTVSYALIYLLIGVALLFSTFAKRASQLGYG